MINNLEKVYNSHILIRGAGDLASGIAKSLFDTGFKVIMADIEKPTFIRRTVSFGNAIYENEVEIENIKARLAKIDLNEINNLHSQNIIPIIIDAKLESLNYLKPYILIDAIIAKKNLETNINMAEIVIGIGPGFEAGIDVDTVIETKRGHNLGRAIFKGQTEKNTGIPGNIAGYSSERVIYSPCEGNIENLKDIGDIVKKDECIAIINNQKIYSNIAGVLRGIIKDGFYCKKGMKIADVDPRITEKKNCFTISDKSRAIGNATLYTILNILKKESPKWKLKLCKKL